MPKGQYDRPPHYSIGVASELDGISYIHMKFPNVNFLFDYRFHNQIVICSPWYWENRLGMPTTIKFGRRTLLQKIIEFGGLNPKKFGGRFFTSKPGDFRILNLLER